MTHTQDLLEKRQVLLKINYAYEHGSFNPNDPKMLNDAEKEFGDWLNRKLGLIDTPYGLQSADDVTGSTIY